MTGVQWRQVKPKADELSIWPWTYGHDHPDGGRKQRRKPSEMNPAQKEKQMNNKQLEIIQTIERK